MRTHSSLHNMLTVWHLIKYPGAVYESGHTPDILRNAFQAQARTHMYAVKIFGPRARLLRYDLAGATASELFDWRADRGRYLADFLHRLSHAKAREAGIDDSGSELEGTPTEDVAAARASIKEFTRDFFNLQDGAPLCLIKCWDDDVLDSCGLPRSRILLATSVSEAYNTGSEPLIRDYVGYDVQGRRCYHIRDTWAIDDSEHYALEGRTYATLKAAGVRYIAEVECAGVVRWQDGTVQRSRSQDFCSDSGPLWPRYRRVHYRILFQDVSRPVTTFRSTKELVWVVAQAIIGMFTLHLVSLSFADESLQPMPTHTRKRTYCITTCRHITYDLIGRETLSWSAGISPPPCP